MTRGRLESSRLDLVLVRIIVGRARRTLPGGGVIIEGWERNQPLGRLGQPADIGKAAVFLASEHAGFMTGEAICVDGGVMYASDAPGLGVEPLMDVIGPPVAVIEG